MFRNAAGELIQRIAATHRQCETELRKVLVQMKMKSIADIIDINSHTQDPQQRVVIDIDIARAATSVLSELGHHSYPTESTPRGATNGSTPSWEEALRSWGGVISPVPLQRTSSADSKGMRASTAVQLQDMLFRMPSLDAVDDLCLCHLDSNARLASTSSLNASALFGHAGNIRESMRLSTLDEEHFLGDSKDKALRKATTAVKFLYFSPESDTIRNAVKGLIKEQLSLCEAEDAASNLTAMMPLLQAMCGYACARCEDGDAAAIEAYAEGALGDQVRIMRSLVNVFLWPVRQYSGNSSLFGRASEVSAPNADDFLEGPQDLATDDNFSLLLNCGQVKSFLTHAVDFGDMMGLQVSRRRIERLIVIPSSCVIVCMLRRCDC